MTPELADKIMTRIIARVEADGGVLHKSSGIEEIIGACAVAEAEGEITGTGLIKEMSDRQAIQKAWHRVMTDCMAWPPTEVIQARINKLIGAK